MLHKKEIKSVTILGPYEYGYAEIKLYSGSRIYVSSRDQLIDMIKIFNG